MRVTLVKEQKYYPVHISMTKEEFYLVQNPDSINKNSQVAFKRQLKEWKLICHYLKAILHNPLENQ